MSLMTLLLMADVVVNIALDDLGVDGDVLVDGALDGLVDGGSHDVLVDGSLIVDVIDHVLDIVVDIALDDHGVDSNDLVDGLDER